MSEFHVTIRGKHMILCDSCGRRAQSELYGEGDSYRAASAHMTFRKREGWRRYIGRSVRWYCPSCGPRPGHKMRLDERA